MEPNPPTSDSGEITALQANLIDYLKRIGCIISEPVEAAFRAVPRHLFLPHVAPAEAYRDEAIPTKFDGEQAISSSSQPAIMAIMLEQLDLRPGQQVLEIGAGTGYNAALLAQIVGPTGQVIAVDIDEDIVADARAHLAAAGLERVQVIHGDGGLGYPDAAPYDRIILTVGAWDIVPAWREQLRPGGRLVLPLSLGGPQKSVAFDHTGDYLASASVRDCGFMRLRGAFAGPEAHIPLGPEPGLYLDLQEPYAHDTGAIFAMLTGPSTDSPTGVHIHPGEIWGGLSLWLALHAPDICTLRAEGATMVERGIVPELMGFDAREWRSRFTNALCDGTGLAALVFPSGLPAPDVPRSTQAAELFVRSFGAGEALARRLSELVAAWDAARRPGTPGLHIRAYPHERAYTRAPREIILDKRWSRLAIDWR